MYAWTLLVLYLNLDFLLNCSDYRINRKIWAVNFLFHVALVLNSYFILDGLNEGPDKLCGGIGDEDMSLNSNTPWREKLY